tara:strand:- start:7 stop:819 length:813 start_codon:yes stop_codon:yes gene_type:complete
MKIIQSNKNINELNMDKVLIDFCFGQMCEDFLVNLIFKNKTDGTYIDIGAHDGIRFSNSYAFSILGWKGICVEAHPDYYDICYNNRNNDNTKIMNVCCSNVDSDKVTFYLNYRGSLSTLNPDLNDVYKKDYKGYYIDKNHTEKVQNFRNGPIEINSRSMDSIIEENSEYLNKENIDLISIDVDGSEKFVLPGFDILKYKPRVIIFEVSVVRSVVEDYMKSTDYYKLYDNNLNAIYCRDLDDYNLFNSEVKMLNTKETILECIDTGHPLGN